VAKQLELAKMMVPEPVEKKTVGMMMLESELL